VLSIPKGELIIVLLPGTITVLNGTVTILE
jgi:hypothetical protein